MHSLLGPSFARAPERCLLAECLFDFAMPRDAVRANERQPLLSPLVLIQSLPGIFRVASVSTLGATVRLHIARREAKCVALQAHSVTAVLPGVVQHLMVEGSGGLVLLTRVTLVSLGLPTALDSLFCVLF